MQRTILLGLCLKNSHTLDNQVQDFWDKASFSASPGAGAGIIGDECVHIYITGITDYVDRSFQPYFVHYSLRNKIKPRRLTDTLTASWGNSLRFFVELYKIVFPY